MVGRRAVLALLALALAASGEDAPSMCLRALGTPGGWGSGEWLDSLAGADTMVDLARSNFCRAQVPASSFLETEATLSHLPAEFEEEEVEWERQTVTGDVPEPRMGAAVGIIDGEVLVAGGCSKQHICFRDLYMLNTASMSWRKRDLTGIAPARQGTTSVVVGTKVYVFGGYDGVFHNDMYVLDTTLNTWDVMATAGDKPAPRSNAAMAKGPGNTIYLFGGTSDISMFNDFYKLDVSTALWEKIEPLAPSELSQPPPREGASLSMAGNRAFLFGGDGTPYGTTSSQAMGDLWVYNLETATWREPKDEVSGLDSAPWPRRGHTATVVGDRLEVFGGCTSTGGTTQSCFSDLVTLNIDTMTWSRPLVKGVGPEPRSGSQAISIGRTLLYFGGCDDQRTCFPDVNTARLKFSTHRPSCPENDGNVGVITPEGFSMECPNNCTGNGLCHQGTCFCDPGYDGADCSRSTGCPNSCSNHGTCENGRCYCNPGFGGKDCGQATLCPFNCSYRGVCHNGRCECDPGYTGLDCGKVVLCPHNCTKRGICLNGACFCSPGYGGEGCELVLPCPNECSGNGRCHKQKCFCNPGFEGFDCATEAACPLNCSHRGVCMYGQCHCDPSYGGASCEKVATCPGQCNQRGVCLHDRCVCEPGFTGSDCSQELFRCQANCSRHGVCRFGKCYCFPGYEGDICETAIICPNNCTNHGICLDGQCLCSQGFGGSDCSHGLACPKKCSGQGTCSEGKCYCDIGFAGADCSVAFPCPNDCSGHGMCHRGQCYCDAAHSGFDCAHVLVCNNSCSGHGTCANGRCFCNPGFYGHSCDKAYTCQDRCNEIKGNGVCRNGLCHCLPGFAGVECEIESTCPDDCSGAAHGVCANGMCYCAPGYTGSECAESISCPGNCRGHGECQNGKCYCDPGYGGTDCVTMLECADDCSQHGQCVHGKCFCDPGYGGDNCAVLMDCPDDCSSQGVCVHGQCFCDAGFAGDNCATTVTCPSNCNGNGVCVGGSCVCVEGYQGRACQETASTSSGAPGATGSVSTSACPAGCSGHGLCLVDGTCQCDTGFIGDDCSVASTAASRSFNHGKSASLQAGSRQAVSFLEVEAEVSEQAMLATRATTKHKNTHGHVIGLAAKGGVPVTSIADPESEGQLEGSRPGGVYREGDDRSHCTNNGIYKNSKCHCDPGFTGDTCRDELPCPSSCSGQGTCAMGLCYCDPGWTGRECTDEVGCPNDCSGNGVCFHGRCSCDAAFEGDDCSDSKPRSELQGLTVTEVAVISCFTFVGGLFLGLAAKARMDSRRKAKFNAMLQEEVNRPFVSSQ